MRPLFFFVTNYARLCFMLQCLFQWATQLLLKNITPLPKHVEDPRMGLPHAKRMWWSLWLGLKRFPPAL